MYLRFLQEAPPSCSADTEWLELSTNLKSSVLDHMAKCTMSSIYNKCNYAAKFIYKHLLEPDFPTNRQKFDVNCKNLKSLSHTCIVRYIDIIIDHDTRLPVLIMELRDKNLTGSTPQNLSLITWSSTLASTLHKLCNTCTDTSPKFFTAILPPITSLSSPDPESRCATLGCRHSDSQNPKSHPAPNTSLLKL